MNLQTNDFFRKKENRKSMQQILLETIGLQWQHQKYDLDNFSFTKKNSSSAIKTVGVNIGASKKHNAKIYPYENTVELISLLVTYGYNVCILSGPEDKEAYLRIKEYFHDEDAVVFNGTDLKFQEYFKIFEQLDLVVSTDSFALHVALGFSIPTVSLWGPQPIHETLVAEGDVKIVPDMECIPCFASSKDHCMIFEKAACMKYITPSSIVAKIQMILS